MKKDNSAFTLGFFVWVFIWGALIMPSDAHDLIKLITNPLIFFFLVIIIGLVFFDKKDE